MSGPKVGDAFGEALLAVLRGGEMPGIANEIVERDDGFLSATDAIRYFGRPESFSAPVQWALGHAHGRVLDVGLGAGRHALAAQERGCQVTGIDISPGALQVARERGVGQVVKASIHDLPTTFAEAAFDTVLMLGQNVALMGSPAGASRVFRDLHRVTAEGAVLIGASLDPSASSEAHHTYFARNRARGRWPGHCTLRIRWRDIASAWFDYFFCTPAELIDLARPHGWGGDPQIRTSGTGYTVVLRRTPAKA